jgi:hypothetical protein
MTQSLETIQVGGDVSVLEAVMWIRTRIRIRFRIDPACCCFESSAGFRSLVATTHWPRIDLDSEAVFCIWNFISFSEWFN